MSTLAHDGLSVTYASDRHGSPDLRLIHYNDVYHVEYDRFPPRGRAELTDILLDRALQSRSAGLPGFNHW